MPLIEFDRSDYGLYWYTSVQSPLQGGTVYDSPQVEALNGYRRIMFKSWTRTPGYWEIRRNKLRRGYLYLPMNDFFQDYTRIETKSRTVITKEYDWVYGVGFLPTHRLTTYNGDTQATIFGSPRSPGHSGSAARPIHDLSEIDARLQNKTLLKLKDQKINLVQAFGEREQLANMLTTTVHRVASSVRKLKSGDLRGAAKVFQVQVSRKRGSEYRKRFEKDPGKAVANAWLELQYGWLPFLSDVYGAAELVAQKTIREVRNRTTKRDKDFLRTKEVGVGQFGIRYFSECQSLLTTKYTLWYSTDSESHTLAQMGITNPLHVAWELTPWSHVVDWFIPIGNYLSSLDASKGLKFLMGCKTSHWEIIYRSRALSGENKALGQEVSCNQETVYKRIIVQRDRINSFPQSRLPSFQNPLSYTRAANAIAHLVQLFKR